jgi:hypothetical protein
VQLLVGGYSADFPRKLIVESSPDGITWTEVWSGSGAAPALAAALRDPQRVPVSIPLPGDPTRFLRFTQKGTEPVAYWSIAELRILAR